MQLTRQADYGVQMMMMIARSEAEGVVTVGAMSEARGLPRAFLAKIARQLCQAGLLRSSRGAGGGLRLARPAEEITLRQIVEALEGPILLNWCLLRPGACAHEQTCPVHGVWQRAQADLVNHLDAAKLSEMATQQAVLESELRRKTGDAPGPRPELAAADAAGA